MFRKRQRITFRIQIFDFEVMKNIFSVLSIFLSCCLAAAVVRINNEIAAFYLATVGKGRALFGLAETLRFGYQYYLSVLTILSIVFSFIALKKNESKTITFVSFVLIIITIILLFSRIWRLMI
jgi:hypothetical protein